MRPAETDFDRAVNGCAFLTLGGTLLVAFLSRTIDQFSGIGGTALAATAVLAAISGVRAWIRSSVALEDHTLRIRVGTPSRSIAWSDVESVRVDGVRVVVRARDEPHAASSTSAVRLSASDRPSRAIAVPLLASDRSSSGDRCASSALGSLFLGDRAPNLRPIGDPGRSPGKISVRP